MGKMPSVVCSFGVICFILWAYDSVNAQCESGEIREYEYPIQPQWHLRHRHVFSTPFTSLPAISYGIIFLDGNYYENYRANVTIDTITKYDVTFRMHTWHDTKLFGLGISWMACESSR